MSRHHPAMASQGFPNTPPATRAWQSRSSDSELLDEVSNDAISMTSGWQIKPF
jgi:hypothetical protein